MTIEFFVAGTPKPAGSKRAFAIKKSGAYTGRVAVTDDSGKPGKDWRKTVSEAGALERKARAERGENGALFDGPLLLALTFYLKRPQSHSTKRGLKPSAPRHHTSAPDSTKLTRSVEDALTGVLYRDDAQIVAQSIQKRYCDAEHSDPGVLIYLCPFDE